MIALQADWMILYKSIIEVHQYMKLTLENLEAYIAGLPILAILGCTPGY